MKNAVTFMLLSTCTSFPKALGKAITLYTLQSLEKEQDLSKICNA